MFRFCFYIISSLQLFQPVVALTLQNKTDVETYYAALSSSDTNQINAVLQRLLPATSLANKAYAGALIMKKAGLIKAPGKKLSLFKQGRLFLEEAITKENSNVAYRFLRLVIQENCPAFLKYHDNIKEDSDVVKKTFVQFPAETKRAVIDYAKTSATLKSLDLK